MKYLFAIRRSCFYVLVFLGLWHSALAEVTDSRKKQLMEFFEQDDRYDCKYLPAEEKEFLKGYFYEIRKRTNNPEARDHQLLQVGDEATIERYIKEFNAVYIQRKVVGWQYGAAPERSGQARFIELYAPILLRDEPFDNRPGDTPGPPFSYEITVSVIRLLRESPQLSPEVRHWALSLPDGMLAEDMVNNRTILRKWWQANERHFHERNYAAVQPPPEAAATSSHPDTSPPSPTAQSPTTPPPAAPAAPEPAAENSSLLAGLITALCATLLALAYWLKVRRKPPSAR